MKWTVCRLTVAAVTLAVAVAQAAPIAPLPRGISAAQCNLAQVQYNNWRDRRPRYCGWFHQQRLHCW